VQSSLSPCAALLAGHKATTAGMVSRHVH